MIPNLLSALRIPLAFAFLYPSTELRAFAIFAASATDFFDGYVARRLKLTSRLGTILDPIADKFFVIFAFSVFVQEGELTLVNALLMLSRDIALIIFGLFLVISGNWKQYRIEAIWSGKIATGLQLLLLLAITGHLQIPEACFLFFVPLGFSALFELFYTRKLQSS